jgi:hypothetical protein
LYASDPVPSCLRCQRMIALRQKSTHGSAGAQRRSERALSGQDRFSAASDGTGPYSVPLVPAKPGPVPPVHGPPSRETDPGLLLTGVDTTYQLKVRWYTVLDDESCFARWLLIPRPTAGR